MLTLSVEQLGTAAAAGLSVVDGIKSTFAAASTNFSFHALFRGMGVALELMLKVDLEHSTLICAVKASHQLTKQVCNYSVDPATVGHCRLTHSVCSKVEGILKTTFGVNQSVTSANVTNNGMKSHCGMHASNTRK